MSFLPPPGNPPPPPARRSRRGLIIGAVAGLVLVLLVVGAAFLASRANGGTPLADLHRADCFNLGRGLFGQKASRVRCSESHTDEVAGVIAFPAGGGAPYPGRDGILELGKKDCPLQVTEFYGQNQPADAETFVLGPDEAAWKKGKRAVVCSLREHSGGPRRGSYLGQ